MGIRTILLAVIVGALATVMTLAPATSDAQVQKIMRLQGRLLSQAGSPIPDGDYGVTVRFYKKQNDAVGDALLTYLDPGVSVKNGLFSISVGETTKLNPKSFYSGEAAWMGLKVGSDAELPRIALHYVAYALRADVATNLDCTGCVTSAALDPKVLEPFAKSADLHKVAKSGKYGDLEDTPDLTPYAKSADLHKVAKTGKYSALDGKPTLADLKVCAPGEVLQGYKPDGTAVCVKDQNDKYSGKDFALSNSQCDKGSVVQGFTADGKAICVPDQKGEASGKDFALSNQKCAKGLVSMGVDADGKPLCVKDNDTTYAGKDFALSNQKCAKGLVSMGVDADGKVICVKNVEYSGKDFALSNQKCAAGYVLMGVDADGKPLCVKDKDTTYAGKDFALSNQKCAAGYVSTGVDADGKPLCVKDKDTTYAGKDFALSNQKCASGYVSQGVTSDGKPICVKNVAYSGQDFALSNQKCATGQVLAGISDAGKMICVVDKDNDTKYSGKNFALSNQKCPTGQVLLGVDANGIKVCATDKDTKYSGKNFALSNKKCSGGQVVSGVDANGYPVCAKVATADHNHNYDVNHAWLSENGQNAPFKIHGGKQQVVMRTDGTTPYNSGIGSYPFVWMYGGDVAVNRLMMLANDGALWTSKYGWLHTRFAAANKSCASGKVMKGVDSSGNPVCVTDQNTTNTYKAGTGLLLSSNTFSLNTSYADARYVNEGQANAITGSMVKDSSLTGSDIKDGSLTGSDIKDGSLTTSDVKDGSLTGLDVADSSLTGSDVKNSSLTGSDILDSSLTGSDIKNSSLSGSDILDSSLTGSDIKNGSLQYADTDVNSIQRRVASSCPAGKAIQSIKSDGTVVCAAEVGPAATKYSASVAKGNWYRFAWTTGGAAVAATFTIYETTYKSQMQFRVGISSNDATNMSFALLHHSRYTTKVFDKIRVLEGSTSSAQYLDIKFAQNTVVTMHVMDNLHQYKWNPQTPKIVGTSDTVSGFTSRIYEADKLLVVGDYKERLAVYRGGNVRVSDGYLGVGGSMSYPLHVTKGKSNDWQARFTHGNNNTYIGHANGSGMHINNGLNDTSSRYILEARNNKGTALYVRSDRRVGINTTAPGRTLHVNGASRLSGQVGINGDIRSGYGANVYGNMHLNNGEINYVSQLHFNDNVRLYDDGNDNYLNFKYGDSYGGGIRFYDGNAKRQGTLYSDGDQSYSSFGLLDADGNWAVRVMDDKYTALYENGSQKLSAHGTGVAITGNLDVSGELRTSKAVKVDGNTVIDDGAGWHRSYNKTGWYNQTYGGGIYQEDSTYVRVYGSKRFRADGGLYVGSTHVAKGGQSCGSDEVLYGFNSSGNKLCKKGAMGTVYTRWGYNSCPSGASLVYWGWVGGAAHNQGGSGSNYLCLRRDPNYLNYSTANQNGALMYGTEFETASYGVYELRNNGEQDNDVACAVCYVPNRNTVFMQPANYSCPSGWHREYYGYLMASHYTQTKSTFICVDRAAQVLGSNTNSDGALLYPTEIECGALACSTTNADGYFKQDKELTCAVCSR